MKLGLLATVAVAAGFSLSSMVGSATLFRSTSRLQRESAGGLAASVGASLRTAMLAGDGMEVRRLVSEVKRRLPRVGIRVFSARGEEVFGAKPPLPPPGQVPVLVRDVVASGKPAGHGAERALPIERDERCGSCHAGAGVVGVLTVGAARTPERPGDGGAALDTLAAIVRDGFLRVMLKPVSPRFNEYFAALSRRVPGLRGAVIYGPGGKLAYGAPAPRSAALVVRTLPLRSEPRCLGCHESASEIDGSRLAVGFDPSGAASDETVSVLIATTLREVMAAGLGRLAEGFLDDVARTGAVRSLTLHDAEGRLYHDAFGVPSPPAEVAAAIRTGASRASTPEAAAEFVFVEPLRNSQACQSCHGSDSPMRGAIEVTLNTGVERAELASLRRSSVAYGVTTIVLVLAVLGLGLYYTVILPVRAIGSVADRVGAGRLDASVHLATTDEMGRLGRRINEMVRGLRQKIELSKFVSHDTLAEVESQPGVVARGGERRRLAVVFSDIRGFTAFADSHEPEAVVEMLNRCLQAQAEVIVRHGGDIDKFVGDEIMARFVGPDMAARATHAAVEMVRAVARLAPVGVGVNVGDAVLGSVGAERRMDFTAIGDAINLASRLCAAAEPGEVLVTETVRREVGDVEGVLFTALDPLMVKGKREPVEVYRATAATA